MSQVARAHIFLSYPLREESFILVLLTRITFQLVAFLSVIVTLQTAVILVGQVPEIHILCLCPLREELFVFEVPTLITLQVGTCLSASDTSSVEALPHDRPFIVFIPSLQVIIGGHEGTFWLHLGTSSALPLHVFQLKW